MQDRELGFWKKTAIPLGNLQQVEAFDGFKSLPRSLGRVLEIGAGPYTKIFLMLEVLTCSACSLLNDCVVHAGSSKARDAFRNRIGEFARPDG